MTFDPEYFMSLIPVVVIEGGAVTLGITFGSYGIALVVGLAIAIGKLQSGKWIGRVAEAVTQFIRNTPLLIQLYFLYYVLPDYGIVLHGVVVGLIGLGIHYSTYTAEIYRAGLESIPKGQWEAAVALGFGTRKTFSRIILPQAVRVVIPSLGNYLIYMYKATPYLAVIAVPEMLNRALTTGAITFRYLEPLILVGLAFLTISYASAFAIHRLERAVRLPS